MGSLAVPRRRFLLGVASLAICAPAVVRASSLMRISAEFCDSARGAPPWAATEDALALLQHEMERRFAETLFGAELLSAEAETSLVAPSPVVAEAKTTALWALRTWFGPRGSPPRRFEELPGDVQARLSSMFGSRADARSEARAARFADFAAHERCLCSI
jgi:hypothetical protein